MEDCMSGMKEDEDAGNSGGKISRKLQSTTASVRTGQAALVDSVAALHSLSVGRLAVWRCSNLKRI
jgi:hypothetical protein